MKSSKGKELIQPDRGWFICEYKHIRRDKNKIKKFYLNQFNRKLRQLFKKIISKEASDV